MKIYLSKDDEYDFYHLKKDSSNLKTLKLLVSKDQDLAAKVGKNLINVIYIFINIVFIN